MFKDFNLRSRKYTTIAYSVFFNESEKHYDFIFPKR
ncbi:hypothetical protein M2092_000478 [Fusobacterium sp. PH5-44]